MKRSTERILVSHAGTIPRPPDLQELRNAGPAKQDEFDRRLPSAVKEVVARQAEVGIDVVNDGEFSKLNFIHYARDRLGGIEPASFAPGQAPPRNINGRDAVEFPEFFGTGGGGFGRGRPGGVQVMPTQMVCITPISYIGRSATLQDISNMKAALDGLRQAQPERDVEGFLPAVAPGTIEHWLFNQHYASDEELLFAIADAMHEEYELITSSGLNVQIDDPDLPDGWQMFPSMSVDEYRKYAELRVDALNHALRGIPEERVRLHVCWGSGLGPHKNDIDLRDIIDLILKVNAQVYSIEAANPRHQHEWRVFEDVKLAEGKSLMPGVIGHATDIIEHPRLIADRLVQYANLVGRDNVIAGTDCGVGSRVWNAEIMWAKFEAMVEGSRLATRDLWG